MSDAVTVAVWPEVTVPAVAVNVAELAPVGTVKLVGTDKAVLLLESDTVAPGDGAASFSVTVQVEEAPEASEAGLQPRADTPAAEVTVITPPVAVVVIGLPIAEAPTGFVMPMATVVAFAATVTLMTATTPFSIALLLIPDKRQV